MKHSESWTFTKAEPAGAGWRASRNPSEVGVGSRFVADLMISAYAAAIRTHARGVLADIGCGKMPYYGIYRDLVTDIIGVDWPSSLHGGAHVDVLCDLNTGIELADGVADTVLCTDVLEHIYHPARLWHEIARILSAGGVAIIGTPFLYWVHEAPNDYYRYTRFALERSARDAGLEILSSKAIGGLPHVLADIGCKVTQRLPWLAESVRLAAVGALRFGPLQRAADRSSAAFPLAHLVIAEKPAMVTL